LAIKDIIKNTFLKLKKKGSIATPDNYYKEFAIQAKLVGEEIFECKLFDDIVEKLTLKEQMQVKAEKITTFSALSELLMQRGDNLQGLAYVLNEILAPSIQYDIEEEIEKLSVFISKNPKQLLDRSTISKLKEITKKRINNDRKVIKEKADDITKLTSLMGKYFDRTLIESGNSLSEVSNIKNELEILNISNSSSRELGVLKSKLIDTVYELENSIEKSKIELLQNKSQFNELQETVTKLQKELQNVKEERNLDYLTSVLNRRAFDQELEKIEKKHQMFGTNYAVVFYDIDYFKSINDNYGHDCGDAVLRTFAGVLKGLTRQEDVLARYGGEEFVVLLNYSEENELVKYLKRVKELIANSNFNYKNHSIELKFSAGLSFRRKYGTSLETLQKADELLYIAKNTGRDRIILDNDMVL